MNTFQEWLEQCPVNYEYLSKDEEGQIAYVFYTTEGTDIQPVIDTGAGGIDDDILNPKKHPRIGLQ